MMLVFFSAREEKITKSRNNCATIEAGNQVEETNREKFKYRSLRCELAVDAGTDSSKWFTFSDIFKYSEKLIIISLIQISRAVSSLNC